MKCYSIIFDENIHTICICCNVRKQVDYWECDGYSGVNERGKNLENFVQGRCRFQKIGDGFNSRG